MVFSQIWDETPFTMDPDTWHEIGCCDCGLVHKMRLTIDTAGEDAKQVIIFQVKVAKGKTKKLRKEQFKGLVLPKKDTEE